MCRTESLRALVALQDSEEESPLLYLMFDGEELFVLSTKIRPCISLLPNAGLV